MSYTKPKKNGLWESLVDSNPVAHLAWSYSWTFTKIVKENWKYYTHGR